MSKQVSISRQSYGKIFLHSAKYIDGILIGFLIGNVNAGSVNVTDILPVSHSNPAGPILDMAGDVTEKLFTDYIVGIYYAADVNKGVVPSNIERIIDNVSQTLGKECIVVKVVNSLLASKEKLFVEAVTSKNAPCKVEVADKMSFISSLLDALLIQKIQSTFSDFEDHLNSSADVGGKGTAGGAAEFRNPIAGNFIEHYQPTV